MAQIRENATRELTISELQQRIIAKLHSKGEWISFEHEVDSRGARLVCIINVNRILASFLEDGITLSQNEFSIALKYLEEKLKKDNPNLRSKFTQYNNPGSRPGATIKLGFGVSLHSLIE